MATTTPAGNGSGSDDGAGNGSGSDDNTGNGNGSGSDDDTGNGSGNGNGNGSGSGSDDGAGNGNGNGQRGRNMKDWARALRGCITIDGNSAIAESDEESDIEGIHQTSVLTSNSLTAPPVPVHRRERKAPEGGVLRALLDLKPGSGAASSGTIATATATATTTTADSSSSAAAAPTAATTTTTAPPPLAWNAGREQDPALIAEMDVSVRDFAYPA
ncbi:hypothetical protein B0T26DRAFT_869190 [Lasiosphaeria miniovina]|uniref:Uncharacterized protein n=1 Tax=Lasiosphaeria miniovina TaxID=1954250 RepID=A0AA40B5G2_9PEZI|nr:uncharacterized protein B0T26DRAFT_869190 [Lasiosphaeria miniovina]KAK0728041.1 hypothetical protein B0T26DRAFT_869190 [Lasiosphaeria miniovina]